MSLPQILEIPGGYKYLWKDEMIQIITNRLHNHSDGRLTGELAISTTAPSISPHIHQAQFNFSSTRSRKELTRTLEERMDTLDWYGILEQVSVYTMERIRRGEPLITIDSLEDAPLTDYLLFPVLPAGLPTILFGEGSAGKGHVALLMAICVFLPWLDNPYGIKPKEEGQKILYLDWEADKSETLRRVKYMTDGLDLGATSISYLRCDIPLPDDLERIQRALNDSGATLVIVDSLGAACGADLNNADTALHFYTTIRQLKGATTLLIGHTNKNALNKTVFGSVYFYNLARSVWELKKSQEVGRDQLELGLFHRKSNVSRLFHPIGFSFHFGNCSTSVRAREVSSVAEFEEQMPVELRIKTLLQHGAYSPSELADELVVSGSTIRVTLARMKEDQIVTKIGNKYGLLTKLV